MGTIINADHEPAVFVGIDWGGTHHQVCAVNAEGVVTIQHKIEHTVAGLAEIDSLLDTFAETGTLRVSIEHVYRLVVDEWSRDVDGCGKRLDNDSAVCSGARHLRAVQEVASCRNPRSPLCEN